MGASKYLPPFTQGQRGDAKDDQRGRRDGPRPASDRQSSTERLAGAEGRASDRYEPGAGDEATYADFLGEQIDD
jgi:hypothetical protein